MSRYYEGFPKNLMLTRDDSYELELRLTLDDEAGNIHELKFTGVRELGFYDLNCICKWGIVIEDISSNGLEDIHYSIREVEEHVWFECRDVYEYAKI